VLQREASEFFALPAGKIRIKSCSFYNVPAAGRSRCDADNIVDLYNRHAYAWVGARLREAHLYARGWLEKFCGLICAGGSVLDIGCGAGEPMATYLVKHGYSVTDVDSSRAMIELFRERLPDQEALVADMRMLSL
jgi:cyclopropane fatty-acyl-phospholipid synthase-like methyltransferase